MRQLTQGQLAQKAGVAQSTIAALESDDSRRATRLAEIARALDVSSDWLALVAQNMQEGQGDSVNGMMATALVDRRIPVLNNTQATAPTKAVEAFLLGESMPSEPVGVKADLGRLAFGWLVDDESMFPEFLKGDLVFMDPEITAPRAGDYVHARINGTELTFRKYRPRGFSDANGEVFELVPISPDYAPLLSNQVTVQIVATMVGIQRWSRR